MGIDLVNFLVQKNMNVTVTSRKERTSNHSNVIYIRGDAKDLSFLQDVLKQPFDVIVDFMSYSTEQFRKRIDLLLSATNQYIFVSSARVYAESMTSLTEVSPRLLDVCTDRAYLETDEYALAKARQEDFLMQRAGEEKNYTIVRPSLTYNYNRLQFALSEKEEWLYRALSGKSILFPRDMVDIKTTMGYGKDVARAMAELVGNPAALGEIVHITGPKANTWQEILDIYQQILEEKKGLRAQVYMVDNALKIANDLGRFYQIRYARAINREFDCSKLEKIIGKQNFLSAEAGLKICLTTFLEENIAFSGIDAKVQGYFDKKTGESMRSGEFVTNRDKLKYVLARYTPYCEWKAHL